MDKKVLNERLNELIRQIRLNSKDAHFAEKLTEDLLSVHRQKLSEKSYVFDIGAEQYKIERNSFYIAKHEKGVLFHIYNSFDLVVPISNNALYATLIALLEEHYNEYESFSDEDKLDHDTYIDAVGVILAMPLTILTDTEFAINIATQVVQRMDFKVRQALEANLQDETIEQDAMFRDKALGAEVLKENIVEGMDALAKQING
jgi:hypothetical protein